MTSSKPPPDDLPETPPIPTTNEAPPAEGAIAYRITKRRHIEPLPQFVWADSRREVRDWLNEHGCYEIVRATQPELHAHTVKDGEVRDIRKKRGK